MADVNNRFAWTTGGDKRLVHRRWIDAGGSGVVHELYNTETNQSFARKLLRLAIPEPRTARNELRAIKKLCDGTHKHIIKVLEFGDLPDSSHAFIDMELCSLNLDQYNKSIRTTILVHPSTSTVRTVEIWSIIAQVADGLAFIHKQREIHRDLKPQNVLYSVVNGLWKIADFGLTSEGTSQSFLDTEFARGTSGYRAPELLRDQRAAYNNKVDIWALGCILYELVVGARPFASDFVVLEHYQVNTSLNPTLDKTIDSDSATILSTAIEEMVQKDPSSRPTAATLHEAFSRNELIAKMQYIKPQPVEGSLSTGPEFEPIEIAEAVPIFRQVPSPYRSILTASEAPQWVIVVAIVNTTNTRIATDSCDVNREYSQVTLWNALTGDMIWRRQYSLIDIPERTNPTFSGDGKYFGVHHGDRAVEILDAESATLVNTVEIQSEGRIAAMALLRNGKGMGVAMDCGILNVEPKEKDMATLSNVRRTTSLNITDIIQTRGVHDVSMAYDTRGRFLFLVGNSTLRAPNGREKRVAFYWDITTRSRTNVIFQEIDNPVAGNWCTPLYNMPGNDFVLVRGFTLTGEFLVDTYTATSVRGCILSFKHSGVLSYGRQCLLVLGHYDSLGVWDKKRRTWVLKDGFTTANPLDKTVYKYLYQCEGKGLDHIGEQVKVKLAAKLVWSDMPTFTDVKAMAETESGLTLMLEGEKIMFFEKRNH